jgi:O-antigen/teichoic acid export membrane protein
MKNRILGIFSTNTFKQSAITSVGTIVNGFLGLIFYILIARNLGPASFGIFSVATATMALLASIFNVGVDTGLVRFVGKHAVSEPKKANRFLKLGLKIKIVSGLFLVLLGWFLIPFVAITFFAKPELAFPLRLSLIGAFGWLLSYFVSSALQSFQKFIHWSGLNIFINSLRLIVLLTFIYLGFLNINSGLYLYLAAPFFGFFIGLLFLPKFWQVKNENEVAKEFFHYNKWVAVFTIIVALSSRVDTYLSTRLLSLGDLGIYSVANNLSSIVPEIVLALATVVAPKFASFTSKKDAAIYFNKLQLFVLGLALAGILFGIPLSYYIIPKLYGFDYLLSITPFIILLLSQAIFLISIPVHTSIFYYFANPKVFVYIAFVHLLLVSGLGWILIGKFGYIGAAMTMLFGNVFNYAAPAIWVLREFKKKN